jgi:hypothetical protein
MNNRPCERAERPSWWRALTEDKDISRLLQVFHDGYGSRNVSRRGSSYIGLLDRIYTRSRTSVSKRTFRLDRSRWLTTREFIGAVSTRVAILFSFGYRLFLRKKKGTRERFAFQNPHCDKIVLRRAIANKIFNQIASRRVCHFIEIWTISNLTVIYLVIKIYVINISYTYTQNSKI